MHEPPSDLADATLRAFLRDRYGLPIARLTFLPLGHDSSAWVYRARTADKRDYFLKVRTRVENEAGLLVPHHLRACGISRVVAPLPTITGELWAQAGDHAAILYPFVAGVTGRERGLSPRQWADYGAILRQIHEVALTADLARLVRRETFAPAGAAAIRRLDAQIGTRTFDDPIAQELAGFWRARRGTIRTLVDRAEELGKRLAAARPAFVLCHADIHTGNVLLDPEGRVWIVDWDETMLAPRERDLMFVVGGIGAGWVAPDGEAQFFRRYGAAVVEPLALAYYRFAWAVGDIGAFGEEVLFRPDLGPVTRRAAVDLFIGQFRPGNIVALAFAANEGIP